MHKLARIIPPFVGTLLSMNVPLIAENNLGALLSGDVRCGPFLTVDGHHKNLRRDFV